MRADVDGMVDAALDASQEGGLPTRVWRYATGGEVDVAIAPQVTYSNKAIDEFVAKVAAEVNTEPVNASIEPTAISLDARRRARTGSTVSEADASHRGSSRWSRAPTRRNGHGPGRHGRARGHHQELAAQYPTYLTVDRSTFELRLWKNLSWRRPTRSRSAPPGFDTPAGRLHIQNKAGRPAWNVPDSDWAGDLAGTVVPGGAADNPLKARWMGIFDGAGIHGTDDVGSLGSAASHGCVRMAVPDVIELYDQVPVGTPIYIG